MFLVARDELNSSWPGTRTRTRTHAGPEWQIQTLMYGSAVVARSPDADSRTLFASTGVG